VGTTAGRLRGGGPRSTGLVLPALAQLGARGRELVTGPLHAFLVAFLALHLGWTHRRLRSRTLRQRRGGNDGCSTHHNDSFQMVGISFSHA
jgi:hypothetical protein